MIKLNSQEVIYKELHDNIIEGELDPGESLPSLRSLADQYKTSTGTVRQALNRLRIEGYICSLHGKGNFVANKPAEVKNIMLIAPLEGHLFSEFTSGFSKFFSNHPECQVLLEQAPGDNNSQELHTTAKIEAGLAAGTLDAIFFDGMDYLQTDFLGKYVDKVNIFCFHSAAKLSEFMCPSVASDWFHGGYIGIQHLYDMGCRHPMIITNSSSLESPTNDIHSFLDGCKQAAEKMNLTLVQMYHQAEEDDYADVFAEILRNHPEVDGIFANADFRFRPLYPVLRQFNRTIGEDIALLGYYDTPWAQAMDPALSSVSIKPEKIVSEVCDLYFNNGDGNKFRRIPPDVIIRESSCNPIKVRKG